MNDKFSILVNSTDSYEDCWFPFFKLFNQYWSKYTGKIYLNTENKTYVHKDLDIISIKNGLGKGTWSECLICALKFIEEEIILYLQDDYFLRDKVDTDKINELTKLLTANNIDCIHLTDQATSGPFKKTKFSDIWEIDKFAPNRINCQAALWKKDTLRVCIKTHESAGEFEHYATKRSLFYDHKIFNINTNNYGLGKKEILPYIFTGIVRGKWNKEVIDLSNENNIIIDFSKRGFYKPNLANPNFLQKLKRFYSSFNSRFRSNIDLLKRRIIK